MKKGAVIILCICMSLLITVGYATVSENLYINGSATLEPPSYPVYITQVSPKQNGNITVNEYFSTVMVAYTGGTGSATFTVTVKNNTDKTYVFERIVTGAELEDDSMYDGGGITYSLSGIQFLTEIASGESINFSVTISVESDAVNQEIYTYFKFIEKTHEDILPDGESTEVTQAPTESPTEAPTEAPGEVVTQTEKETEQETEPDDGHMHSDMLGLAEALRSEAKKCLNADNTIWSAVQKSITDSNRPDGAPAMVYCNSNKYGGMNLINITQSANSLLTSGNSVFFVILADEENPNRLYLYMYYEDVCDDAGQGQQIDTYLQVIERADRNSKWEENGTYKGMATVDRMWIGIKNEYAITIDPRTWYAPSTVSIE